MTYQSKPTKGVELYAWVFMRLSGVFLLLLALGHLYIMHLLNTVEAVNYDFVAQRFQTPYWRVFDGLLLVLAMGHGVNGMRIVIRDYVHRPGAHRWALRVLYGGSGLLLVLGLWVLLGFTPKSPQPVETMTPNAETAAVEAP